MGLPFMPVRGLLGTDYLKLRPDFKIIEDPYAPGEKIVIVPAINPDVSLFHAYKGDRAGNVLADATQNNKLLAQATRRAVIVTFEELTTTKELYSPAGAFIPSHYLTATVHLPGGAHPTSCQGYYKVDRDHMRLYVENSATAESFTGYLEEYLRGMTEEEYLAAVGAGQDKEALAHDTG